MSRHTYYRNIQDEDYEDEDYGSSFGSSYGSDHGLSKSLENQYMFQRDQSGHTPQFSNFLDNLGEGEVELEMDIGMGPVDPDPSDQKKLRRMDSVFDTTSLSSEDLAKLNSCLDHILDIVGETVPEFTIKETIVKCNYDAEKALSDILSRASSSGHSGHSPLSQISPPKRTKIKLDSSEPKPSSSKPQPMVTTPVVRAPKTSSTSGFSATNLDSSVIKVIGGSSNKSSRSNSPLPTNKLESMSIETPKKSDLVTESASVIPTPVKQVLMRKSELNVNEEYKKARGDSKEAINLIVIGHVDSGKSTLMGHLLFQLGQVSQKIMHKYEQESRKVGKQSFMYAWVLDETDEERERGITMDVGQNRFETDHRVVTLLDAPGHRDFIPNMISGAYQADVAVLVVNATTGEFEAGFDSGGQTREHALLVRSLGVSQLCVAVNKLDTVDWDMARFETIKGKLKLFLTKQAGFKESDLSFIPCSGLTGENLTRPPSSPQLTSWYSGDTLVGVVDTMKTPVRAMDRPFRLAISDIFRALTGSGFSVSGRVEAGVVMKDDKVLISPLNEVATVKSVDNITGFAGDHVVLTLTGPDQSSVSTGMVLCDPSHPAPITAKFLARIVVFNIETPITKGFPVIVHYGSVSEPGNIKKLVSLLNKSNGEVVKNKPRCLTGNQSAVVEISLGRPIPLELYKNYRELGRFMLRSGGNTLAAGMVTEIL